MQSDKITRAPLEIKENKCYYCGEKPTKYIKAVIAGEMVMLPVYKKEKQQ